MPVNGASNAMGILAAIIFVPFVLWGVFNLHRRYRYQEEGSLLVQGLTLLGVLLFFAVALASLRVTMQHQWELYLFTVLGMFVAGAALYGHMAISLATRLLVDMVSPGHDASPDRPRFGPAEMLERVRDFEGALQEYRVIARVYPHHPAVHVRIAEALLQLDRPDEAAQYFERSLRYLKSDDKSLPVVTRLCDVYYDRLNDPMRARLVLAAYLKRFPDSPFKEQVHEHLAQFGREETEKLDASLQALEAAPLGEDETGTDVLTVPAPGGTLKLEPMDGVMETASTTDVLERIEDGPDILSGEGPAPPRHPRTNLPGLEALDEVETEDTPPPREDEAEGDAGGLERM